MNSSQPDQPIDYLVIGHITRDLTPHGHRIGGAAAYAAVLAKRAGLKVGVVTSTAGDLDLSPLQEIPLINIPAAKTTSFQNSYTPQGRTQSLISRAAEITYQDIPPAWRRPRIIHLAPVIQEVSPGLGHLIPSDLLGMSLQGWLRRAAVSGEVTPSLPADFPEYSGDHAVGVVSSEDLGGQEDRIEPFLKWFPVLILTRGSGPISLYLNGSEQSLPVTPHPEIDPTGAGDIFTSAFLIAFARSGKVRRSARAAADLAAISVGQHGLDGVPESSALPQIIKVHQAWEKSIP